MLSCLSTNQFCNKTITSMDSARAASLLAPEIRRRTAGASKIEVCLNLWRREGRAGGRVANVSGGGRRSTHTYTLTNEEAGAGKRGLANGGVRRRREQRPSSRLGQGRRPQPDAYAEANSDTSKTSVFAMASECDS